MIPTLTRRSKYLTVALTSIFLLSAFYSSAFAQDTFPKAGDTMPKATAPTPTVQTTKLTNPFSFGSVSELVDKLLNIVITVGTVLALFFLIYSGFLFVTAGGNEEKLGRARATFLTVIIGVAIVLGSKAIADLLQNTSNNIIK